MVINVGTTGILQSTAFYGLLGIDRVDACLVKGYRVEGGEHPHIRHDGEIVLRVAIAVRRDVDDKVHMEVGSSLKHCLAVLGDFVIQDFVCFVLSRFDGIFGTDADAAPAAHALVVVDGGLFVGDGWRVVSTDFFTLSAAHTELLVDIRFSGGMHLHLAGPGTAAHTDIFQGAAESGQFMAFKMIYRQENVRVHDRSSDLCLFYIFAALHRDIYVVSSFESVGDQHMAAGVIGVKPVLIGALDVIERVLASAHIQGVAVGEERFAVQILDHIHDSAGVVRAEICQISRLSEVNFDGDIFVFKIHGGKARLAQKPLQFHLQRISCLYPQIGKIYF